MALFTAWRASAPAATLRRRTLRPDRCYAAGPRCAPLYRLEQGREGDAMTTVSAVALVAAGSGMGAAAAARRLAQDGFKVAILVVLGRRGASLRELGGLGVTGSNQSGADLGRLVDATIARWGRIDVLVNSAGHGPRAPILEITDDDWHKGLDVYLLNVIRPTRLVVPHMQKSGGGTIVNISTGCWPSSRARRGPTSAAVPARAPARVHQGAHTPTPRTTSA